MQNACPADEPFLFQLYKESRADEIRAWGWDDIAQQAFFSMQWTAQQRYYASQYPNADHLIVYKENIPIGRIVVNRSDHEIMLIDLTLLRTYQNQGIGTQLLLQLQDEAAALAKPILLSVLHSNPAQRLYERLGFRPTGSNELYCFMEWKKHYSTL